NRRRGGRAAVTSVAADRKLSERVDAVAPLLLAALALAFAPLARELVHLWRVDPYAGHGMFVPAYSAVLLWFDRQRLAATPRSREPAGALVVLAALALLWAGWWAHSVIGQGLALVIAVAGGVLWQFGRR